MKSVRGHHLHLAAAGRSRELEQLLGAHSIDFFPPTTSTDSVCRSTTLYTSTDPIALIALCSRVRG